MTAVRLSAVLSWAFFGLAALLAVMGLAAFVWGTHRHWHAWLIYWFLALGVWLIARTLKHFAQQKPRTPVPPN